MSDALMAPSVDCGVPSLASMRLIYSFVLDGDPRFLLQGRIFLHSLLAAGVSRDDIVAHVTPSSGSAGRELASSFGVRSVALTPGPDGKYTNKINQCFTLDETDFDVLVACDTDLAILHPLTDVASAHEVRARRVDSENPPLAILEGLRVLLGVTQEPRLVAPSCAPAGRTYALNCNGGMLMIPKSLLPVLGGAWLKYAVDLLAHVERMQRWPMHVDQVAWAFAMMHLNLPFAELPIEYNFPTGLAKHLPPGAFGEPVVLHYHGRLDRNGLLKSSGVAVVDRAIQKANGVLRPGRWWHRRRLALILPEGRNTLCGDQPPAPPAEK
jgi:hypothetical protein